ncbi:MULTISPECIES: hypothetical protein [Streptomyces]|uniref:hypothetical protein n=1 Tax=Streptomyces TaxID=1883 RepID=UPI00163C7092|nr:MULTISPECIES: hypothetical protein [Streptomyces]MBC2878044.1 hypothetical protein [Streptomyces sp. TYQ1024]UBI39998.1 hypothetical protein K7I03_28380 [Streptomyces mobaraensis]UKW32579.1 hypothetical protein MCU78_28310 [Streptomyces sp. TYQ1024]
MTTSTRSPPADLLIYTAGFNELPVVSRWNAVSVAACALTTTGRVEERGEALVEPRPRQITGCTVII